MDDLIAEIVKGFFRAIGHLIAEIFFGTICYWLGWPICKLATFGKYPSSRQAFYLQGYNSSIHGFWCCSVGLIALIAGGLFAAGLL